MVAEELKVVIRAETARAVAELKKAQDASAKTGRSFGSMIKSIAKVAGPIAAAALGFRALSRQIRESIELAGVQEQAERGLEAALVATGESSAQAAQAIKDYASELQGVTTYGDEATIAAAALFTQVSGLSAEMTRNALPALQDFASAMGMDLQQAASLVGRSIGSTTNALSRYGIQIEEGLEGTERFDAIVGQLNEKFGGFSQAVADTSSGALVQFQNALGDLKEVGGAAILDFIEPAVRGTQEFVEQITAAISESRELRNTLADQGESTTEIETLNAAIAEQRAILARAREEAEGVAISGFEEASAVAIEREEAALQALLNRRGVLLQSLRAEGQNRAGANAELTAYQQKLQDIAAVIDDTLKTSKLKKFTDAVSESGDEFERAFGGEDGPIPEMNEGLEAAVRQVNELNAAFSQAADDAAAQRLADQIARIKQQVNDVSTAFYAGLGAINAWSVVADQAAKDEITLLQRQVDGLDERFEREINFLEATGATQQEITDLKKQQLKEQEEAEDALEEKKKRLAEKQFRRNKALNIAETAMNTASAIVEALPNIPLSIVVGALGAAQLAGIAAQQMPAFEKGGSFVTSGPQAIMVGDGASPRERVTVEPLSGPYRANSGGNVTINISGAIGGKEEVAVWVNEGLSRARRRGLVA